MCDFWPDGPMFNVLGKCRRKEINDGLCREHIEIKAANDGYLDPSRAGVDEMVSIFG